MSKLSQVDIAGERWSIYRPWGIKFNRVSQKEERQREVVGHNGWAPREMSDKKDVTEKCQSWQRPVRISSLMIKQLDFSVPLSFSDRNIPDLSPEEGAAD